jgi:hypothetical protein
METRPIIQARPSPVFQFETLCGLPCGCVTAAYRAEEWDVSLVSIEAKGPYCPRHSHFIGQVLELGDVLEARDDPEE